MKSKQSVEYEIVMNEKYEHLKTNSVLIYIN